eukprot:scaffold126_cov246-Pinguiococcus_pyrenoidosus.AAC.5
MADTEAGGTFHKLRWYSSASSSQIRPSQKRTVVDKLCIRKSATPMWPGKCVAAIRPSMEWSTPRSPALGIMR